MKSKQQEPNKELDRVETPCKECVFSEYEHSVYKGFQTGCSLGRLEKFKQLNQISRKESTDGKTYNIINRFCNTFRSQKWKNSKSEEDLTKEVEKEIECGFSLIVDCQNHSMESIEKTLRSIKDIEYDQKRITIVLHINGSREISNLVHMANQLKQINSKVFLISNTQQDKRIKEYDIFSKCVDKTFFTTCKVGSEVPKDLFSSINETINKDLAKIIFFESKETNTVQINVARKAYLDYMDYDKMLEDIRIQSKQKNMYGWYEKKK